MPNTTQKDCGPRQVKRPADLQEYTLYLLVEFVQTRVTVATVARVLTAPFDGMDGCGLRFMVLRCAQDGTRTRASIKLASYNVVPDVQGRWEPNDAILRLPDLADFPAAGTDPLTLLTDVERRCFE